MKSRANAQSTSVDAISGPDRKFHSGNNDVINRKESPGKKVCRIVIRYSFMMDVTRRACIYSSKKASTLLKKGNSLLVIQADNTWYNRPSWGSAGSTFGNMNSGSFRKSPTINNNATFPGAFCLNIPITGQCYELNSIFAKQT